MGQLENRRIQRRHAGLVRLLGGSPGIYARCVAGTIPGGCMDWTNAGRVKGLAEENLYRPEPRDYPAGLDGVGRVHDFVCIRKVLLRLVGSF